MEKKDTFDKTTCRCCGQTRKLVTLERLSSGLDDLCGYLAYIFWKCKKCGPICEKCRKFKTHLLAFWRTGWHCGCGNRALEYCVQKETDLNAHFQKDPPRIR